MARSIIASDDPGERWAAALREALAQRGHEVTAFRAAQYPIADPLPVMLIEMGMHAEVGLVVLVGASRNHDWVAAELVHRELYPRLVLALGPATDVPRGWSLDDPRLPLPTADPAARVDMILEGRAASSK